MTDPAQEEIDIEWAPPPMWPVMPDWLHDCPRCDSETIVPEMRVVEPFGLRCDDCGWTGPREGWDDDPDAAIFAWDKECRKIDEARKLGLTINWARRIPSATRAPSTVDACGRADGALWCTETT